MKIHTYVYKNIIVLLAILLALSGSNFNMVSAESQSRSSETEQSVTKSLEKQDDNEYKRTDEVNIIVELDTDPGIIVAQRDNKRFSELSENKKNSLHNKSINEQEIIKEDINASDVSIEYLDEFTAVFNGFSANVLFKDIEVIEQIDQVKAVYISEEYEQPIEPIKEIKLSEQDQTEATSANEIVNAPKVWEDVGYTGEGMVVAVIDRGIDVDHRDFILSDETEPALGEGDVKRIADEQELFGRYYTEKVPYGYNYADKNDTVKNMGEGASGHGIHVSGIIGANGDLDNSGIKGVAPEVQILAMKVYSNDQKSSTNSSIYVKAIDDAIKLDVDAINISLGSTARILNPEDPAQIAAKRATENGIFVAKSAGNGSYFGEGHEELPYATNPDIGVISNAQLAEAAVEVANFENSHLDYAGLVFSTDGKDDQIIPFNPASKAPSPDDAIDEDKREVVYVGYGRMPGDSDDNPEANDYEDIDVEGKIVLIKRGGGVGFLAKTLNAQEHGAAAVVVFNNADSGYSSMSSNSDVSIPQVFILREPGEDMVQELESGNAVTIAFRDHRAKTENPQAGQMYKSSAWGPMGGLDFKPSLAAPGSHILSTLNDDSYGVKSGTSMSTPQVAGGSTLVMERIQEEFDVSGLDLTIMTKNILMNTAKPVINISDTNKEFGIEDIPYSPRRQGAGVMDLYAAVTTPVVITDKQSGQGGVALKEIGDTFTFSLEAVNHSNEDVTYNVEGNIQADVTEGKYNYLESVGVINESGNIPIDYSSDHGQKDGEEYQLTIPANGTAQLDVTVDLSETVDEYMKESIKEYFTNGRFIEGFIEFHDPQDIHPELSVPYVGFYGEWNKPPVLDEFNYAGESSFYGSSGMLTDDNTDDYLYLGIDRVSGEMTDHYAISPNDNGINDNVLPALSFLRNAKDVEFVILDSEGKEIETLFQKSSVRKHYDSSKPYTTFDDAIWDGTVNGEVVEDGLYYYAIKTRIDYEDVDWQTKEIPVYVDTVEPQVEAEFDSDTFTVQWTGDDNEGSEIVSYEVIVNDEFTSELLSSDVSEYILEEEVSDIDSIVVIATDWAGNQGEVIIDELTPTPPTIADMKSAVDQLLADGQIKNRGIARSLTAQLETIERFENKGFNDKAMKHLKKFKELIKKRKKSKAITEEAYDVLNELTEQLMEEKQ